MTAKTRGLSRGAGRGKRGVGHERAPPPVTAARRPASLSGFSIREALASCLRGLAHHFRELGLATRRIAARLAGPARLPDATDQADDMLSPDRRDQEDRLHDERLAWVETAEGAALALPTEYPDGHKVPAHRHSRCQLLYALSGAVLVTTRQGRWMVPPEHAMWLPAGTGMRSRCWARSRCARSMCVPDAIARRCRPSLRWSAITDADAQPDRGRGCPPGAESGPSARRAAHGPFAA